MSVEESMVDAASIDQFLSSWSESAKPQYGRGRRRGRIDYKKLAGEVEENDGSDDRYANKHIPALLKRPSVCTEVQTVSNGAELTACNLKSADHALTLSRPILVSDTAQSIGMRVPSSVRTVRDISRILSPTHPVTVMDVKTQEELDGWTLLDLVDYFEEDRHDRILNQISLEFSHTPLRPLVSSPTFVRDLDWIDLAWPNKEHSPRVQYYCLTSTAGSYTDFHVDFGGTSVWYHILTGEKTFWLLPFTNATEEAYEKWLCSKNQKDIFFLDTVKEDVQTVTLRQHQTLIIPTGWIHAVYTPVDTIVMGGNFLHGLDIGGQLKIHCLETRTRVPAKFRFPHFIQCMFYAAIYYFKSLQQMPGNLCREELDGLPLLIEALRQWIVQPGGDADRIGSVAHTIRECVDLANQQLNKNNTLKDINAVLHFIERDLARVGQSRNDVVVAPSGGAGKLNLSLKSPVDNVKNIKLKLNLGAIRSSKIKSVADGEEREKHNGDVAVCTVSSSDKAHVANEDYGEFRITLSSDSLAPVLSAATLARKVGRIEDLTSQYRDGTSEGRVDKDEDWVPGRKKTKKKKAVGIVKKTPHSVRLVLESDAPFTNEKGTNDVPPFQPLSSTTSITTSKPDAIPGKSVAQHRKPPPRKGFAVPASRGVTAATVSMSARDRLKKRLKF